MAEIRIEKKSNTWLPWLLGLLALVLVGWAIFEIIEEDPMEDEITAIEEVEDMDDAEAVTLRNDPESDSRARAVNATDLDDFDGEWDGLNADFDANFDYYITSLEKLDAEMNLNHDYSNVALRALANSLVVLAREEGLADEANVRQKAEMMRAKAAEITDDWRSPTHADKIRNAAMAAVNVMQEIQKAQFPELNEAVMEVKQEAQQIDSSTLTLEQKENVKSFFRTAAEALEEMRDS